MKTAIISILLLVNLFVHQAIAQDRYFTKSAAITFNAEGVLDDVEEIRAKTNTATCVIDASTGQIEWAVLMKSFQFKNALMQEHFNENYVESSKFPKASFKGMIEKPEAIKWEKDGTYTISVSGKMTLHGVTKDLAAKGTLTIAKGLITASSDFMVFVGDFDIEIPALVGNKVSKEVQVNVNTSLSKLGK